ncbi:MAG: phosphatidate cytidylyltransferase, partial [Oscillospiraceae bacterium]
TLLYTQVFGRTFSFAGLRASYYIVIALLGGVASVLGIVGDLFASAIKRQRNIKDYGTIFPGHGGVLDRFDSVLFIAPLVTFVVRVLFYHFKG